MEVNRREALRVSVVVPVYNQWDRVPVLLEAIAAQTFPPFEVLLVDNGSSHVPPDDDDPDFVRRLECRVPGSYAARNVGLAEARGQVIFFTDADCRPEPGWIEAALQALRQQGGAALVAGAIRVEAEDRTNLVALYDSLTGMPQQAYVRKGYGITANLVVPRAVADVVGNFDETRFSGGDADFCRRAARAGYRVRYCEAAAVVHPARTKFEELATKMRRVKGGQLRSGSFPRRCFYLLRSFLPPFRGIFSIILADGIGGRERFGMAGIVLRLWLVEMRETVRLLMGAAPERR